MSPFLGREYLCDDVSSAPLQSHSVCGAAVSKATSVVYV